MTIQAWETICVVFVMFVLLTLDKFRTDMVIFISMITLVMLGVLSPKDALFGFFNEALVTISTLCIIVSTLQGQYIHHLLKVILGKGGYRYILLKLMLPVAAISAFTNNTPIVAALTPIVKNWGIRSGISPSKLLIPLAYAASMGGICTLIGTSTTLLINSLMIEKGMTGFTMFQLSQIGIPCLIIGTIFVFFAGGKLLPEREIDNSKNHYNIQSVQENTINYKENSSINHFNESPGKNSKLSVSLSLILFILMIITVALGILPIYMASSICAALLILSRLVTIKDATKSIEWNLLLMIGSSFGIAKALEKTGVASFLADGLSTNLIDSSPIITLGAVYLMTWTCTEILSNNGSATLMFPVAYSLAENLAYNFEPIAITIAIAASSSFATPIGYQTNLIVYVAGGYKFNDFMKIGIPLSFIYMLITILIVPLVWPLK